MKETKFIEQNKEKWERFEKLSHRTNADPDEISRLFVEITDDLSYARTHYPKRTVRVYLNYLAQGVFLNLYKVQKTTRGKFFRFWVEDLPREMYRARKILLFNFIFFVAAGLIGAISTDNDPDFPAVILGSHYLDYTDHWIEQGDPMHIYSEGGELHGFVSIGQNNLRVALMSFTFGILFSLGTLFFMFYNGVMVGCFKYYLYIKGAFAIASSALWLHGAFELSAIVLAGTAGVVVGNSLLFPGTYTRGQSLMIGGKRGIKIMVGTVPFIVVAAFIEGYVTRHYLTMPTWMNWGIIFGSLAIILGYFVIYPYLKYGRKDKLDIKEDPVFTRPPSLERWKIRNVGETFTATFSWYRHIFSNAMGWFILLFMAYAAFIATYIMLDTDRFFYVVDWRELLPKVFGLTKDLDPVLIGIHTLFISLNASIVVYFMKKDTKEPYSSVKMWGSVLRNIWFAIPFVGITYFIFAKADEGILLLSVAAAPLLFITMFGTLYNRNVFNGVATSFRNFFESIMVFLVFFLFFIVLHYFLEPFNQSFPTNLIFDNISEMVGWHAIPLMDNPLMAGYALKGVAYVAIVQFILPLLFIAFGLQFFSVKERVEAHGLYKRLQRFGKVSKVYESEYDLQNIDN